MEKIKISSVNEELTAVEYCETKYPEMMKRFKEIQKEQYKLFASKQKNYGPGNISLGTSLNNDEDIRLSLMGLFFRMNDKIQRIKQLIVFNHSDEVGESVMDTYQDLSIYSVIAQLVTEGKWGK
jgi:hypothetical protein